MIPVSFAPLEGLTDRIFRNVHHRFFPEISAYYIPFVDPGPEGRLTNKEIREIQQDSDVPAIPQVLTNTPDKLLRVLKTFADLGYREANLNLGCPSGTVTAKYKGSGALQDPESLQKLLCVIDESPITVSVKTRIGYENDRSWNDILSVYRSSPISKLIIHPRFGRQQYKGALNLEAYDKALQMGLPFPIVYNGELNSTEDCRTILCEYPGTAELMIGRGFLRNPGLICEIYGQEDRLPERVSGFVNELFCAWHEEYGQNAVFRMKAFLSYLTEGFAVDAKVLKSVRKARKADECLQIVLTLFD